MVWGRTRTEATWKARKALRAVGLKVGRVEGVPTERFERIQAWVVYPSDRPATNKYIAAWNAFHFPQDEQ